MEFAEFFRELRGQRSQEDFAELLGLTQAHVSRIESGMRPSIKVITALIRQFPEQQERVFFLLQKYANNHECMQ
jgi:transcriptional regulator with XRE-family HTH domain